jgi:hypothetical protein
MKEGRWKEVTEYYITLEEKMRERHCQEETELKYARVRAYEQLAEMCVAEHGSHVDDGSMFHRCCKRCGILID